MTREFKNAQEFVEFLEENETIRSILPFAEELMALHKNINKGCNCKRNQRIALRYHVYNNMIKNDMTDNADLQDSFKKYSGASAVTWRDDNELLLEI